MRSTLIIAVTISLFGCGDGNNGKDGADGTPGPTGADGSDGESGADGAPGTPGADGADGSDGTDGQDCWDTNGDGAPNIEEDTNGDGVVDVYDCAGAEDDTTVGHPYLGDLIIREKDQADYFCDNYDSVLGSLHIEAWSSDLTDLVCLETVSQDLTIDGETMTSVSLPNLRTVGGKLSIQSAYAQAVRFVSLTNVDGLLLDQTGLFTSSPLIVSFPSLLESLGQNEFRIRNCGMEHIDFSNLTLVEGAFEIENNTQLLDLSGLDSLAVISGDVSIIGNESLCETDAWLLVSELTIGGSASVSDNGGICP